jgi:nucleotide-binding universal stress UspA family protein
MKILIAADGSICSVDAVREIAGEAWPVGTKVRALFVLELLPRHAFAVSLVPPETYAELEKIERARANQFLDEAVAILEAGGFSHEDVSVSIVVGEPKRTILEEAKRWGADLVVVGSHGYGPWKRLLLGSVSNAVALQAPCSVRIVRARKRAA